MPTRTISIRGARTHNLKNVSVEIPQRQLTVLTGPSGSGETKCPDCGVLGRKETPESITNAIAASLHDKRVVILAPVFFHAENRGEVLMQLIKAGYYRAWIGGEVCDLKETDTSGTTSLEL